MTPARSDALIRHIHTLASLAEAEGFRAQLTAQGEEMSAAVYSELLRRVDELNRRGMK